MEHKFVPFEFSKKDSDKVTDQLIYKNHNTLIKNIHVFLENHHKKFVCRRCSKSYKSEISLKSHIPKYEQKEITTIKTSSEPHLQWKK